MINRQRVLNEFAEYVKGYNADAPKIALKIKHTYKVSELCEIIAKSEHLSDEDVDIAWICGMLHDIGRFEQCRIYDTFNDSESVDHAKFGCELLFGSERLIDRFCDDEKYYQIIHDAIYYHSVYRIPEDMDERTAMFTNILRDSDKLDIIRANNETSIEDIYNCTTEELKNCAITDEVLECFYNHTAVLRSLKRTPIDNVVGHISLMFELVYKESRKLAKSLGYLDTMMDFKSDNPETRKRMVHIKQEMDNYLNHQ